MKMSGRRSGRETEEELIRVPFSVVIGRTVTRREVRMRRKRVFALGCWYTRCRHVCHVFSDTRDVDADVAESLWSLWCNLASAVVKRVHSRVGTHEDPLFCLL